MVDFELLKYAMTQGGLLLVCLVLFHFYRRDVLKRSREAERREDVLIAIVEKSAISNTELAAALRRFQT